MKELTELMPQRLSAVFDKMPEKDKRTVQDIRLRKSSPFCVTACGVCRFVGAAGNLCDAEKAVTVFPSEVDECFYRACKYSVYSVEDELKNGFVTVKGGHRVGIAASAVTSGERIDGVKNISSLDIRVARQVIGCSDSIMKYVYNEKILGAMILSEPCGGKTTILRDIARNLSENGLRVCIIDERGELCAMHGGVSPFDLGYCTDVLDMFPKAEGIRRAVRTLSPSVIVTDEVGSAEEAERIFEAMRCGVGFVLTAHASNMTELCGNAGLCRIAESGCVKNLIFLRGRLHPCEASEIVPIKDGGLK